MKIINILIVLLIITDSIFSLAKNHSEYQKELFDISGIYKYTSTVPTDNDQENHFLVIENKNNIFYGRYYGTSDDFDQSREGYLPGFYVATMQNLNINNQLISFKLNVNVNDFHIHPIDIKTDKDNISIKENPIWVKYYKMKIDLTNESLIFNGKIYKNKIIIELPENRVFNKIN